MVHFGMMAEQIAYNHEMGLELNEVNGIDREKEEIQDSGGAEASGLDGGLGQEMATEVDDNAVDREADDGEDDVREREREDEAADDAEEGRKGRGMPSPVVVSRQEREEHELTHLPYRCWCPHC